jgi:hypothetical protein
MSDQQHYIKVNLSVFTETEHPGAREMMLNMLAAAGWELCDNREAEDRLTFCCPDSPGFTDALAQAQRSVGEWLVAEQVF